MYNSNTCRSITPKNSSATISNNGTNNNQSFTLSNFTVNKNVNYLYIIAKDRLWKWNRVH